jgi:Stress responsive A/B Barrel Domain
MIRHTVAFKLKHAPGSTQEQSFLQAARELATIPRVRNFECLRQVSPKNNFDFGLSMEFASLQDYDTYNIHPDHVRFVQTRWMPEVQDFLEIDYAPFSSA